MARTSNSWKMLESDAPIWIILAVALIVTGAYIAGPWYVGGPTTAVGVSLEADIVRAITGVGYLAAGTSGVVAGLGGNDQFKYWGTFAMFLAYSFMALLRLFSFGLVPIFWLIILVVALIAGLMYLRESKRQKEEAGG